MNAEEDRIRNRERQKRWRERALRDPDGHLLTRCEVFLGPSPQAALERIIQKTGWTKRRVVEEALLALGKSYVEPD